MPGFGVWLRDHAFLNRVEHCTLAGNLGTQLRMTNLQRGPYGDYIPNQVLGCTIAGGALGVFLQAAIVANFVGVTVYQTHGGAIRVTESSNSVGFTGCRTFQITGDAYVAEDSHEISLTGNVFC